MDKVDKCTTLEELTSYCGDKITVIEHCINLQGTSGNANIKDSGLGRLLDNIEEYEKNISLLKNEINKRKKSLASIQEMREFVADLQGTVDRAQANIPARLPTVKPRNNSSESAEVPMEKNKPKTASQKLPVKTISKTSKSKLFIPEIEYITVAEFESIPKYIKGRLTYDRMNAAVDDVNKTLSGKYSLIATKRSAQNDYIRNKIISYKEEETKDTKGTHYFTERDTKEFTSSKVDGTYRTVMTILRHCKRIKEVRGGGVTRYVLCNS